MNKPKIIFITLLNTGEFYHGTKKLPGTSQVVLVRNI